MRRFAQLALLALLAPAPAAAQTLTVDVEATGAEPVPARASIEAEVELVEPRRAEEPARPSYGEGAPPVVVVVPPLEDVPAAAPAPAPSRAATPAPAPALAVVATPAPAPAPAAEPEPEEDDLQGGSQLALLVEQMDLGGMQLDFHDPELGFLEGLALSPGFEGQEDLRRMVTGGASLGVGMRVERILRGPELRLQLGGASVDQLAYHPLPGAPDGIEAAIERSFYFRLEAALGVQVELGPFVPYALARAAVGGVWVDVAVRDRELGDLGTETVDGTLLQLGLEAGAELRVVEGLRIGAAFRGSFLGTPSLGGAITLGWVGPDEDA